MRTLRFISAKFFLWKSLLINIILATVHCLNTDWQVIFFYLPNQTTMIVNENNSMPYMKSLSSCLAKIVSDGYTEDFKVTDNGLEAIQKQLHYSPDHLRVINFFRFEGESDPADNAILYVIETEDGTKGTLVDSYGTYNDSRVAQFLEDVIIQKKAKGVKTEADANY